MGRAPMGVRLMAVFLPSPVSRPWSRGSSGSVTRELGVGVNLGACCGAAAGTVAAADAVYAG